MSEITQEALRKIIEPVAEGLGCLLWGIEFRTYDKNALLRVYIDKLEGVTLDDCSDVSHQLSAVLDVEDPIGVPYTLEVSSPGVERPLFGYPHYQRYLGQRVKLRLMRPVDSRRNFEGVLEFADPMRVRLRLENDVVAEIPLDAIARGQLKVDFEQYAKEQKR
ncbi:MAG: ribosome maturation factor RimP [Thiotrichales bacterium]